MPYLGYVFAGVLRCVWGWPRSRNRWAGDRLAIKQVLIPLVILGSQDQDRLCAVRVHALEGWLLRSQ